MLVAERLDETLRDFCVEVRPGDIVALRAVLFQVFHALETAWATHRYTHNDLHDQNVMLRSFLLDNVDAPLRDQDFLYKRAGEPNWFRVPRAALHHRLVKLIDFGRNRLYRPSRPTAHTRLVLSHEGGYAAHVHDKLLFSEGLEDFGVVRDEANRRLDVVRLLFAVLSFGAAYWHAAGEQRVDRESFFALCEAMLDFGEINALVVAFLRGELAAEEIEQGRVREEYRLVKERVSPRNLHTCPAIRALLKQPRLFVFRVPRAGDVTASDALNHAFFDAYRQRDEVPERQLDEREILDRQAHRVVVSFLAQSDEAQMRLASARDVTEVGSRCTVCGGAATGAYCGAACYEFRHVFGEKTVFRQ